MTDKLYSSLREILKTTVPSKRAGKYNDLCVEIAKRIEQTVGDKYALHLVFDNETLQAGAAYALKQWFKSSGPIITLTKRVEEGKFALYITWATNKTGVKRGRPTKTGDDDPNEDGYEYKDF